MAQESARSALHASRGDVPAAVWDQLEPILKRFEDAWQRGDRPNLDDYLPEGGAHRQTLLVELVHEDQEYRFKAGTAAGVEAYLERYPELARTPAVAVDLIAAEYALRRRRDPDVTVESYLRRFPDYSERLRERLHAASGVAVPRAKSSGGEGADQQEMASSANSPGATTPSGPEATATPPAVAPADVGPIPAAVDRPGPGKGLAAEPILKPLVSLRVRHEQLGRLEWLALLRTDQWQRWRRGDRLAVEAYLEQVPALRADQEAVLELVYGEVLLRLEEGDTAQVEEYLRRLPVYGSDLQRLFTIHRALQSCSTPGPTLPGDDLAMLDKVKQLQFAFRALLTTTCAFGDREAAVPRDTLPLAVRVGHGFLAAGVEPMPGYQLVKRLGQGGFGEVWKATGPGGFELALKFVLLGKQAGETELRALQVIRSIRHVNLLALFGTWTVDNVLIIAMELADGTLLNRLEEVVGEGAAGISRRALLRHVREAAAALDYLNKPRHFLGGKRPVGIQHCDVKPQNLLLLGGGVKVGDFGLAQVMSKEGSHTIAGLTLEYAPPEFFQGELSRHADQYSLAVTYCHLRGGRLPFTGRSYAAYREAHLQQDPDLTMLPAEERPVVARALAKNPRERWPSCRSLVKALVEARPAAEEQTPAAAPAPEPPPTEPPPTRPVAAAGSVPSIPPPPQLAITRSVAPEAAAPVRRRVPPDVGNGYKLISPLGSGTFGQIWRAEAPGGVPVAVKIIFRPIDHEWPSRDMWPVEMLKSLRHPFLTATMAFWQAGDKMCIAMELADRSLRDRAKECRAAGMAGVPVPELLGYFKEAATGLDYLHEHNVLHRDIKPDNLLLIGSHVKVGDFGLVSLFERQLTQASGAGTPAYMPPEVWNGQISKHSDQYSLAITYAELRRGRPVFAGSNMYELMVECLSKDPNLSGLEEAEQVVLRKALDKDPNRRYESCLEFAFALEQAVGRPASPLVAPIRPMQTPSAPWDGPDVGTIVPRTVADSKSSRPSWRADTDIPFSTPTRRRGSRSLLLNVLSIILVCSAIALVWYYRLPAGSASGSSVEISWSVEISYLATGLLVLVAIVVAIGWLVKRTRRARGKASSRRRSRVWAPPTAEYGTPEVFDSPPLTMSGGTTPGSTSRGLPDTPLAPAAARQPATAKPPASPAPLSSEIMASAARPGPLRLCLEGHEDSIWGVAFSPDGTQLLSASMDNTLRLWDVGGGQELARLEHHTNGVTCVAYAPDGRHALAGSLDNTLSWWDVAARRVVRCLEGHTDSVLSAAVSTDGRRALSGGADGSARLWDLENGSELRGFRADAGCVHAVAFSPDNRYAVTAGDDQAVHFWDVGSGEEIRRFLGHEGPVRAVAFSPDGLVLVSGGHDGRLRLWETASGRKLRHWGGHTDWVRALAFARDGRLILSGGDDEAVRVWDAQTFTKLAQYEGHTWSVLAVALSPDGRLAVSGSDDATLRIWDLASSCRLAAP